MDETTVAIADVDHIFNLTSDAIVSCDLDGTIRRANRRFVELESGSGGNLVGRDIKDLLFTASYERASHRLPFSTDGAENALMFKLADGSFLPVIARARVLERHDADQSQGRDPEKAVNREPSADKRNDRGQGAGQSPQRARGVPLVVVAFHSVEERHAHDRERRRLLDELSVANRRLSGTLSIILTSMGSASLPNLISSVLNDLAETLDAKGSLMYFAESGGFKLRGVSSALLGTRLPGFVPFGAGVPTLVVQEDRPLRFTCLPAAVASADARPRAAVYLDLDTRARHRFRMQDVVPFTSIVAVPLHFGTRVLGVIEVGWDRPYTPRDTDVQVLEAVCEYLSIELMDLIASLRSQRRSELARSLSRVREMLFSESADGESMRALAAAEITKSLSCRIKEIERDPRTGEDYFDFGTFGKLLLPRDITPLFFSSKTPAVRMNAGRDSFVSGMDEAAARVDGFTDDIEDRLETVRLTRIERTSPVGEWLIAHGLPASGVFIDLGIDDERRRGVLLMRLADQEPFDDMEYDYLAHMMHDYELSRKGITAKREERRIAQALQRGMESRLQEVPGITSDALYSSATQQALVGGDFFELIRLPDDRAVMILGDVSGKGVEVASVAALVKTALSAYAWEGMSPARMVRALNGMLLSFSRVETFATMFVARIDLRSGRAVYCSAGHPPAMVYRAQAGEVELLSRQSGVVGAFQSMSYHEGRFAFEKGDMLFLYTDGAIEARNAAGDFFGEDRLRELVLTVAPQGVHGFCQRVLYELDRFTDSALNDDIALVMLRFDKSRNEASATGGKRGDRASDPARRQRTERRAQALKQLREAEPHGKVAEAEEKDARAGEKGAAGRVDGAAAAGEKNGRLSVPGPSHPKRFSPDEADADAVEGQPAKPPAKRRAGAHDAADKKQRTHHAHARGKHEAQGKRATRKAKDAARAGEKDVASTAADLLQAPVDLGKRVLRYWKKDR